MTKDERQEKITPALAEFFSKEDLEMLVVVRDRTLDSQDLQ